jgi:hypothetical protein
MPTEDLDRNGGARAGGTALLARAAAARAGGDHRLFGAIADVFQDDTLRLDDRTRHGVRQHLAAIVGAIEAALRGHAVRFLAGRGEPALADRLAPDRRPVFERLRTSALLRETDVMREMLGRVRQDALAEALPGMAPATPDRAGLLPRLLYHANPDVAAAAAALLAAENRRYGGGAIGIGALASELPADLHRRLVWGSAAALGAELATDADPARAVLDEALAEAAARTIAAHQDANRVEAIALRLATVLDPLPGEVAGVLVEALADRRLSLFLAFLAHGLALPYEDVRDFVLDPAGDRLWLALRALDLDRATIAHIGVALADADPHRDVDRFAAALDDLVALNPQRAQSALAPLRLPAPYRAAAAALARDGRFPEPMWGRLG